MFFYCYSFDEDLRQIMPWAKSPWSHTDLQRLKRGRVAAQVCEMCILETQYSPHKKYFDISRWRNKNDLNKIPK